MNSLPHLNFLADGRRAALVFLAAWSFAVHSAPAAVTEAWVQRFTTMANHSNDTAVKVVRDAAGDIIVTGSSDDSSNGPDMLTIKYSGADGSVLWQRRYNHSGGGPHNDDQARALAVDGNGNVVVTGSSYHYGDGNDWYTAKYAAADGALLWEKRYNSPGNGVDTLSGSDIAQWVAVDASGNVVVTGSVYSATDYGYYTIKYAAADGAVLWARDVNDPAAGQATAMAVDGSGNVVVTGSSYTARYAAADGALLWGKSSYASGKPALALDGDGNVVTGSSRAIDGNGNYFDYYMVKYAAADGARLWAKGVSDLAIGSDDFSAMVLDGSGNVVVARSVTDIESRHYDYFTAKYSAADGALLWEKRYNGQNGTSLDHARAVAVDGSGNVVVTGRSAGIGSYSDFYTAKYAAADGALLWEKRYDNNPPEGSWDVANAVVVDGSGNVVVTGISPGSGSGNDYYTAKYAAADGALLWEKRYNGTANSEDRAQAVVMDASGNVVVTGTSGTIKYLADGAEIWKNTVVGVALAVDARGDVVVAGGPGYPYTAKYAAADGALLWEKRNLGPGGNSADIANAVALDGSGNVVVTGFSGHFGEESFTTDYYTAKYAAATGALLWEKRYNGPANGWDQAVAVAVDGSGNVVVTGTSPDTGFAGYDYYTAKYAAANGALLWEKRYDWSGHLFISRDLARAVAVDASGNVVVTGGSGPGCEVDVGCEYYFYTAKYAAANGALLWEQRSTGDGDPEFARAVAVDASGNVLVTGSSMTVKYAAADGALLWRTYSFSGSTHAVAVDSSGNAVVTGVAGNFAIAKFAAANGALLWVKSYSGRGSGTDLMGYHNSLDPEPDRVGGSQSLALGPNGMVAITGSSDGDFGPGITYDYVTVVYRDLANPTCFAGWATSFALSGGNALADADPDRDGLPNAVEYILGGNPAVPGTSGSPIATSSGGNMLFTFSRDDASETPDVTLTVETGTDLAAWPAVFTIGPNTADSSSGVSITENGTAPDTITVTIPQSIAARKFARLKVTVVP